MNNTKQRLREVLPALIQKHYDVEAMDAACLGVSENYAFRVEGRDGDRWFARVHAYSPAYLSGLDGEFGLLDGLAEQAPGLANRGMRTLDGSTHLRFSIDDRSWLLMLFSWMGGVHRKPDTVTLADMEAMAEASARFHKSAVLPSGSNRIIYDADLYGGSDSFFFRPDLHAFIGREDLVPLLEVRRMLYDHAGSSRSPGLSPIHFDLHLGNFLFKRGRAVIIDFDECGLGYPLFDLGHILFALHDHPDIADLEAALVSRYESVTAARVPMNDLRMFQGAQAIAILRYYFRLFDRTAGATNLFGHVPDISRAVRACLDRLR